MRKPVRSPCGGRDLPGDLDHIDRDKMIARCTWRGCYAEVKLYKNDHGDLVPMNHPHKARPQWTDYIHDR
jgi:hypothetical protein